jgi:predicted TIM-barrel fold metal-dependent hydrolase
MIIYSEKHMTIPDGPICDCHVHVFESSYKYPFENLPSYEPPYSPLNLLRETGSAEGISRFVLVQATPYGCDLSLLLDSLNTLGNRWAKGVAVANASTTAKQLEQMRQAGIVGLRFIENLLPNGQRMPGAVPVNVLIDKLAPMLKEQGMHAEIWGPLSTLTSYWPKLDKLGIPIVLDHMGGVDVRAGVEDDDFKNLLSRVKEGKAWIKLAVCRRTVGDVGLDEVRAFHDAFVAANSSQLLWATDFPFVKYPTTPPTMSELLALFKAWVSDKAVVEQILVRNPVVRYGFSEE